MSVCRFDNSIGFRIEWRWIMKKLLVTMLILLLVMLLASVSLADDVSTVEQSVDDVLYDVNGTQMTRQQVENALDEVIAELDRQSEENARMYQEAITTRAGLDSDNGNGLMGTSTKRLSKRTKGVNVLGNYADFITYASVSYNNITMRFLSCSNAWTDVDSSTWLPGSSITSSPRDWIATVIDSGRTLAVDTMTYVQITITGITRNTNIRTYVEFSYTEL